MTVNNTSLILIPGMGADETLFEPQRRRFPDLMVPPWLEPEPRETLPHYARRMAGQIEFPADGRFILGGVSFGGMLALEITRIKRPLAVILIGSCQTGEDIPSYLKIPYYFARLMPHFMLRPNRITIPLMLGSMGARYDERYKNFLLSLRRTSPRFILWASRAIFNWQPDMLPDVPIHSIHGALDRMIPLKCLSAPPDEVIPNGTHLINLQCPDLVDSFIERVIKDSIPSRT